MKRRDFFLSSAALGSLALVGTIEARIPCEHNAVADGMWLPNVFKDFSETDPARRYKMIAFHCDGNFTVSNPDFGYHSYVSPDGLHWTRHSKKPICPGYDVITGFFDRQRKLWVALVKFTDNPAAHGRRFFWLITSPDFTKWSEPPLVMYPGHRPNDLKRKTVYTGSIGLAMWPLDRFVSVDAGAEGGRLTTVPLAFTGNRLELNVKSSHRGQSGSVRVEPLDAAGKSLPGTALSDEVKVDSFRHAVTWSGHPDVSTWQGRPISLRFHLASAELYSFAFRKGKA